MVKYSKNNPPPEHLKPIKIKTSNYSDPYFEKKYGTPKSLNTKYVMIFFSTVAFLSMLVVIVYGGIIVAVKSDPFPWYMVIIVVIVPLGFGFVLSIITIENEIKIGPNLLVIEDNASGDIHMVDENGWDWCFLKLTEDGKLQLIGVEHYPLSSIPMSNFEFDREEYNRILSAILQSFPIYVEPNVSKIKIDDYVIEVEPIKLSFP